MAFTKGGRLKLPWHHGTDIAGIFDNVVMVMV
jgi:hypothetical protein